MTSPVTSGITTGGLGSAPVRPCFQLHVSCLSFPVFLNYFYFIPGSSRNVSGWRLYDADFKQTASGMGGGSATFTGAGNKYLMLFGAKGAEIDLNLAE